MKGKSIEDYKQDIRSRRKGGMPSGYVVPDIYINGLVQQSIEEAFTKIIPGLLKELETLVVNDLLERVEMPKDGETPSDEYLLGLIKPLIPEVKDGETPSDDRLLSLIRPLIPQIENGKTPTKLELLELIRPLIPTPIAGKDGSPDTGGQIVSKINGLPIEPAFQIDARHIKNLPKASGKSVSLARGGLKLVWNVQLSGDVNGVNTVFTIPASQPDPKDSKYLVSARGVLKDVDSGDFTISSNNRTITFAVAPPNGSARPRIPLYHGK